MPPLGGIVISEVFFSLVHFFLPRKQKKRNEQVESANLSMTTDNIVYAKFVYCKICKIFLFL